LGKILARRFVLQGWTDAPLPTDSVTGGTTLHVELLAVRRIADGGNGPYPDLE